MNETRAVVAGSRPWNQRVFERHIRPLQGEWTFVGRREDLSSNALELINPRYVFFLHWSWLVPDEIIERYECVCFHMTDVPYGRGGSPLQNLIVRGHRKTMLTALRMVRDLDAGPVYMKEELSLEGNAEEIYMRAARLSADMIERIVREEPTPVPQEGPVTEFARRRPEESEIPRRDSLEDLHDFIRMLDAEGYPKAFLRYKGFRLEFSRAALYNGRIVADVEITREPEENE